MKIKKILKSRIIKSKSQDEQNENKIEDKKDSSPEVNNNDKDVEKEIK